MNVSAFTLPSGKTQRQIIALYASMIIGLLVSILVSSVNTRALMAEGFGDYKFLQNISMFSVTCATLGFFVSGGRMIATTQNELKERRIVGATIVFCFILYLFMGVGFWIFAQFQPVYFDRDLTQLIELSIPLVITYLLKVMLENLLKGGNYIYALSSARVLPNIIYLAYALVFYRMGWLGVTEAYLGYLGCSLLVYLYFVVRLKPAFSRLGLYLMRVWVEVKRYGFNVYVGSLASVASAQMGGVLLAFFVDTKNAGFFLLARTITSPLVELSTAIGTSFFKKFSGAAIIKPNIFVFSIASVSLMLLGFELLISSAVMLLYPPDFMEIVSMCRIMAVGSAFQGLGGLINNFVCARGYGKYSRNASFVRGGVNLIGFTVGVMFFGVHGAAWTVLASGLCFLIAQLYGYQKISRDRGISRR